MVEQQGVTRVPPDVPALLGRLSDLRVEFVLVGSVAAQARGADVGVPGDLDIVPALDPSNLARLLGVLHQVNATAFPPTGGWIDDADCFRWQEYPADDPRRDRPAPAPDPSDVTTFDSLFATDVGAFDVVPRISGTFDDLAGRARRLPVHGIAGVRVMHLDDLLARLTVPRRLKDAPGWQFCANASGADRNNRRPTLRLALL